MTELAQIVAGWPLVISMAATVAAQSLRNGRRRSALNEALHELRRPLQAVALATGPAVAAPGDGEDPMELAAAALERLDREINGGPLAPTWGRVEARSLAQAAVARWQARAKLADGSLELRWNAGRAIVDGDRCALAQAIDNLIVNAIEHGGPTVVLTARRREGLLRIAVVDSGCASRPRSRDRGAQEAISRLSGRRRHGHGLAVVRRVASAHGGRFALSRAAAGSLAVLELPLADDDPGWAA
ncbi:MAG TPA: HAMP domain-containing sensor histidine kinase [Solirubrobacterales bacterium]|nr:HAMP domain-containing sensor histidine kinase [Solirubrobacterales bacterium]